MFALLNYSSFNKRGLSEKTTVHRRGLGAIVQRKSAVCALAPPALTLCVLLHFSTGMCCLHISLTWGGRILCQLPAVISTPMWKNPQFVLVSVSTAAIPPLIALWEGSFGHRVRGQSGCAYCLVCLFCVAFLSRECTLAAAPAWEAAAMRGWW